MTPRSRVRLVAFRPASRQAVPNVAATLGPVHRRWMTETMHGIASALRPDADFWSGWSAVRFLHDRFDEQYRWQSVVVAAIMPLLPPADARRLRA